jgi:hypothetical protein
MTSPVFTYWPVQNDRDNAPCEIIVHAYCRLTPGHYDIINVMSRICHCMPTSHDMLFVIENLSEILVTWRNSTSQNFLESRELVCGVLYTWTDSTKSESTLLKYQKPCSVANLKLSKYLLWKIKQGDLKYREIISQWMEGAVVFINIWNPHPLSPPTGVWTNDPILG